MSNESKENAQAGPERRLIERLFVWFCNSDVLVRLFPFFDAHSVDGNESLRRIDGVNNPIPPHPYPIELVDFFAPYLAVSWRKGISRQRFDGSKNARDELAIDGGELAIGRFVKNDLIRAHRLSGAF